MTFKMLVVGHERSLPAMEQLHFIYDLAEFPAVDFALIYQGKKFEKWCAACEKAAIPFVAVGKYKSGCEDFLADANPDLMAARLQALVRRQELLRALADHAIDRDLFAAGVLQDIDDFSKAVSSTCQETKQRLFADPLDPTIKEKLQRLRMIGAKLGEYATAILREGSSSSGDVHSVETLTADVTQFWPNPPTFDVSPPTLALHGDRHHCRMLLAVVLSPLRGKVASVAVRGTTNHLQFYADSPLTFDPVAAALARRLGMTLENDGPNKIVIAFPQ